MHTSSSYFNPVCDYMSFNSIMLQSAVFLLDSFGLIKKICLFCSLSSKWCNWCRRGSMHDSSLAEFSRDAMNGVNLCMKPGHTTKNGATPRHNGSYTSKVHARNGYRSSDKSNGLSHNANGHASVCKIQPDDNTWDRNLPIPTLSFPHACLVTFAIAVACFASSLTGDFVFDDSEAILNNGDVQLSTPVFSLFINDFWGTRISSNSSHKSFRPLTVLSFR